MKHITSWSRLLLPAFAFAGFGLAGCDDGVEIVAQQPVMEVDEELAFGNVQVGTEKTLQIIVANTGDGILRLERPTRGQPFDEAFQFDIDESKLSVPPNGAVPITVVFAPGGTVGPRTAILVVRSSDPTVPSQNVTITGEGVKSSLIVDPTNLSFGNVVINTTKTLPITLRNDNDVDATLQYRGERNVRLCTTSAQQDPSAFCLLVRDRQLGSDNTFTLAAGDETTVEVQFTPSTAGLRENGSFTLSFCDVVGCEEMVCLEGVGIENGFRCDPTALDFGQVNPGSCLTRTVSCENIANEQVTVVTWGLVTNGGSVSSPDFEAEAPAVQVLNEGDNVDVDITYCPESLGEDTGTLGIETDNQDARLRNIFVPLSGTGGGPDIEVLPLQLNFGDRKSVV